MLKPFFNLPLDGKLLAEAQRLVDAGEFDSLGQMVENALRDYLKNFDAVQSAEGLDAAIGSALPEGDGQRGLLSQNGGAGALPQSGELLDPALDGRTLHFLTGAFTPAERSDFEQLVIAYSALAQQPLQDGEMLALAEISRTFGLQPSLVALHEAQSSRLPLSPSYLAMLLHRNEERSNTAPESAGAGSFRPFGNGPERVSADFDNPLAAAVAKLYEKEIGLLTERVRDQITTYITEFPDLERWDEAFAAAAGMNKRSLRYVLGVLRGNATKVTEQKGRDNRGLSKSERVRTEKRKQSADYFQRWEEKRKSRQPSDRSE